jgi:hypothetical protein
MKSPFPGMDPYIEARGLWEDFHHKLIADIEKALSRLLPEQYSARLGERAYIALVSDEMSQIEHYEMRGDITVVASLPPSWTPAVTLNSPRVAVDESVEMVPLQRVEFREPFVEIRAFDSDRTLITTIEVLSPSNKRRGSKGWDVYQRKRNAHLSGAANLVEIDLLRGGTRMLMATPWPESPYALLVCRKSLTAQCRAWPATYAAPLPVIPIPLAHPDPDIELSLQPMIDSIYIRTKYSKDIDYGQGCVPPFAPAEEEWFRKRLAQMGSD